MRESRGDCGVSPVVAVILMVAVTVILSAVIGTFVLNLGEKTGDASTQSIGVTTEADGSNITVRVITGQSSELRLLVNGTEKDNITNAEPGDTLTAPAGENSTIAIISVNDDDSTVISTNNPFAGSGATASVDNTVTVPSDGLVSYWKLDRNASDSEGTNDGTVYGDLQWSSIAKNGSSSLHDGNGDYIDAGNVTTVEPSTGSFTISVWVNKSNVGNNRSYVFERGHGWNKENMWLYWADGDWSNNVTGTNELQWALTNNSNDRFSITVGNLSYGTWYHAVYVYDAQNNTLTSWLNGEKKGQKTLQASWKETTNFAIGSRSNDGGAGEYWDGHIDDVRVYNRSLNSSEINNLYTATK